MTENTQIHTIAINGGPMNGPAIRDRSSDDVLDLEGLCNRCMGNLDLVQRVLDKFEKRLPEELVELERVVELKDAAKIALVAHRIKGNSSNVSAAGLQQVAAEIEDLSREGNVDDIPAHVTNLREQWQLYVDCRKTIRPAAAASMHGRHGDVRQTVYSGGAP